MGQAMKILLWVVLAVLGLNVLFLVSVALASLVGKLVQMFRGTPRPPSETNR
jgi:hypothetical protein